MLTIEFAGVTHDIDPDSLIVDEWRQVTLDLAEITIGTGIEPDAEVKAAVVALQVLRRCHPHLTVADVVRIDEPAEQIDLTAVLEALPPEQRMPYLVAALGGED
jgi:hypothetical protein